MLRLTLSQMRRSIGRLVAAGLAIAIGAAFVAATLLSGAVLTRTTYDAAAGQYGDADLVITAAALDDAGLAAVAAADGVEAVNPMDTFGLQLVNGGRQTYVAVQGRATDPRLEPAKVIDGALPAGPGEIAVPQAYADQLEVGLADTVEAVLSFWPSDQDAPVEARVPLTVVGLMDVPTAFLSDGGHAVVDPTVLREWLVQSYDGAPVQTYEAALTVQPGASVEQTRQAVEAALAGNGLVETRDERASQIAAELAGSTWVLTGVVLGFAAVALLVAALVIANTFQVLVAQRTRTLALLRCVGADRRQLSRSVVLEATLLGVTASVIGVVTGIALVQTVLTVLRGTTDVPLPAAVTVTPAVVVVPLLVGTLVTVLASLSPARAATKVSPLAALRPAMPVGGDRSSRVRAWVAGVLVVGGAAGLALGWVVAVSVSMPLGLALGVLGGAVSFVGVMVGAVFWVPGLLARLGRLLGHSAATRLAAANAVRNPRRVATTSGALFIGVTLVAMMSTGAASVTKTFTSQLAGTFPVDVVVETLPGMSSTAVPAPGDDATDLTANPGLPQSLVDDIVGTDGVEASTTLAGADLDLTTPSGVMTSTVLGADPEQLRPLLRDASAVDALRDDAIVLEQWTAQNAGLDVGDTVLVTGPSGTTDLTVTDVDSAMSMVTTATLERLAPAAATTDLWLRLAPDADATAVVADVQERVADQDQVVAQVIGIAVERAFYQRVIDTLLAVVVGLLGVAVVIAMVGVANTLSLSVLERRRESATLRAIGMTRGQLRASLAVEGLLVALVGTVVGAALGVAYGFIGAQILLSEVGTVLLAIPWRDLGIVLVVAVGAGLLASVLPARSATRTPPVEALGAE